IEEDDLVENPEVDQEEDPNMDIDEDEEEEKEEEEWEEDNDWLMASVLSSRETMFAHSTYEVGGPSTAAPEAPYPVGRPLLVVASRVALHHQEIGGMCQDIGEEDRGCRSYQELVHANNTNEVRELLGLIGHYRRLKVGMEKTSSLETKGGNKRLSILIVGVEAVLFFYFHSESALGCGASADFTTEADHEISAFNEFIPKQRATNEEGVHPQLSSGCGASADFTTEADHEISAFNEFIPKQRNQTKSVRDRLKTAHTDLGTNEESRSDEIIKKIKLEDLSNLMQDIRSAFLTLDSPHDEPIIISDESEEEETERYEDTNTTSHNGPEDPSILHHPSPKSV
nr:hypothetical protein [Tanacetum cinerariifolium]